MNRSRLIKSRLAATFVQLRVVEIKNLSGRPSEFARLTKRGETVRSGAAARGNHPTPSGLLLGKEGREAVRGFRRSRVGQRDGRNIR